ncbi:phospholipid carrier-dependent glycosyltransferase [Isoptericola sp. AK164]|uniref:dolichyl-phosphate-mannose--protein mannosyltransferase n=1 Tax=Isoptericola sp. AK164 TaxID=3024246 RepID=UPI0024181645|nr:phospholipid carrier-dependent glycosyltransferase [Isoptericola sp. AK164]
MSAHDPDAPDTGEQSEVDTAPPSRQYPSRREIHGHERRTNTRGIPVVTGAIRALTGSTPTVGTGPASNDAAPAEGAPTASPADAPDPRPTTGTTPTAHPGTGPTPGALESAPVPVAAGGTATATAERPPARDDDGSHDSPSDTAPDEGVGTERSLLVRLLGERRLALGATWQARTLGWVGAAVVTLIAAVARLWELGRPGSLVFDETYYVKDAYTLGSTGAERQWPEDPNPAFEAGDVDTYLDQAAYVVHPPVGKWMMWLGMEAGGGATNPFAWRLASAVVGILAVLLLVRIARRLFASTTMGLVAGFLLAIDGQAIVHSRTALLDQFLMFWVLVAFGCLLLDREWARRRLATRVAAVLDAGGTVDKYGPRLGMRWWRLAAGVSLGLACGVKWSALWFVAAFGLLTVLWDVTARRRAGIGRWFEDAVLADGVPAFLQIVPVALLTYVASWWRWIAGSEGYYRDWASQNPEQAVSWLPDWLASLWHYHQQVYQFHTGLEAEHAYAAGPLGWMVQWRPTSFFWERLDAGDGACPADTEGGCAVAVTALGNPLLWYLAAIALVVTVLLGIWLRDWRALAVVSGTAAGWLPWFLYTDRTIFTFYTIAFTPFVIMTLVYPMVVALERTRWRQGKGGTAAVIAVVVVLVALVSAAFYPFWSAMAVPYDYWREVIRFQNWI